MERINAPYWNLWVLYRTSPTCYILQRLLTLMSFMENLTHMLHTTAVVRAFIFILVSVTVLLKTVKHKQTVCGYALLWWPAIVYDDLIIMRWSMWETSGSLAYKGLATKLPMIAAHWADSCRSVGRPSRGSAEAFGIWGNRGRGVLTQRWGSPVDSNCPRTPLEQKARYRIRQPVCPVN
jgi:hypothetical protein